MMMKRHDAWWQDILGVAMKLFGMFFSERCQSGHYIRMDEAVAVRAHVAMTVINTS